VSIEGELSIRLDWDGARVIGVAIRSTRPVVAGRLLAGKGAREAASMLPRLYSVCGRAQAAAAHRAIDAATGTESAAANAGALENAVLLETVQEYLWRLLIDWPQAMGRQPSIAAVAPVRRQLAAAIARQHANEDAPALLAHEVAAALDALAADHVYGESPTQFLARGDAGAFDAWAATAATLPASLAAALLAKAPGLGRSATALMPTADASELLEAVVPGLRCDAEFARAPLWNGMTVETGALARNCDQPMMASLLQREGRAVVTRMAARLVELASLLGSLHAAAVTGTSGIGWVAALTLEPGDGLAAVQTARGLLLHRARLAHGRVVDYQIVAPTEWNFHPAGPLVQGLEGMEVADASVLSRQARLAIQALDPCVACSVEVVHA
jgi:hypothetical protein